MMKHNFLCISSPSDRLATCNLLRRLGVRILHDSGGRLMVIESPEDPSSVRERLPYGARLLPADEIADAIPDTLDEHEALFAGALKLRMSKAYREAKAAQIPGSSPEEQEIFTASCLAED